MPPYSAPLAIIGCLYLFFSLSGYTLALFAGWAVIGLVVYFTYSRHHSHVGRGLVEATLSNTRAGEIEACQRTRMATIVGGRIDYPTVLGALLLAAVAGVLTHVPAGLGVLEAVFVATLAHALPATEVLATVLAYRAAYYLLPLALALPAYAWSEAGAAPRVASKAQPRPTNGI